MTNNLFKNAIRNIRRNKGFSILNIGGLAIGMASAMVILLWVQNEISFDRFHTKINRLYEVWSNDKINGSIRSMTYTPEIMAPALKKDYPEVEEVTRVSWTRNLLSDNGEKKLMSTGAVVDPGFLIMFDFPLLSGSTGSVLRDPHSIVLTQQLAKTLFNTEDVVGKTIRMGNSDNLIVTGVLKDFPANTQFNWIEYLCPYAENTQSGRIDSNWGDFSIPTFILLKPNSSPGLVNNKIKNIVAEHTGGYQKTEEFLYPVKQLWLYSQFENGKATGGRIQFVRLFSIIAFFILLIACINFMNLSTANSEKRAKEVGIRKVAGARRGSLIFQFLGESLVISLAAGLIALLILVFSLPWFNRLMERQLEIGYGNIYFWISFIVFVLITGIFAGSYPAFFLSGFKPISVLKGRLMEINSLITPRKVLVVTQFSFAIALVICTIVIWQQIKYVQSRNTGYDRDHLIHIFIQGEMDKHFTAIRNDLLNSGTAVSVAKVQAPLTANWSSGIDLKWKGKNPNTKIQINRYSEEGDLVKTAGMQLIEGRDIDLNTYPSDSTACLINESALKLMQFKHPIGEIIFDDPVSWHVVGVIRDYIQESP
ncbi:MAG TPA: ABC transporter permease, partial [Puia sp.]|nr:ABC transporter permease [Puia sp.]